MIKPADEDQSIVWELSYFEKEPYVEHGLDYFGGEIYDAKPATSFGHTMSEIIMAAVENRLTIEHFKEFPHHISKPRGTWRNWALACPCATRWCCVKAASASYSAACARTCEENGRSCVSAGIFARTSSALARSISSTTKPSPSPPSASTSPHGATMSEWP